MQEVVVPHVASIPSTWSGVPAVTDLVTTLQADKTQSLARYKLGSRVNRPAEELLALRQVMRLTTTAAPILPVPSRQQSLTPRAGTTLDGRRGHAVQRNPHLIPKPGTERSQRRSVTCVFNLELAPLSPEVGRKLLHNSLQVLVAVKVALVVQAL